jgi:hypothetical protein
LAGTAFFDTAVTDSNPVVKVWYVVNLNRTFCPPPVGNPCPPVAHLAATPTLSGWIAVWNTDTAKNGIYKLTIFAQDNASGTSYIIDGPITITVGNPPPTTSLLVPANDATLSGTEFLDAAASGCCGVDRVSFVLNGTRVSGKRVASGTPSILGYVGEWNTADVPNGSYALQSEAVSGLSGTALSPPLTITIQNPNPTTAVVFPSNGSTVSGTAVFDATASAGMNMLKYKITGGSLTNSVFVTATPSVYGWVGLWDTTSVPDGSYTVRSVARYFNGVVGATSPGITITVAN